MVVANSGNQYYINGRVRRFEQAVILQYRSIVLCTTTCLATSTTDQEINTLPPQVVIYRVENTLQILIRTALLPKRSGYTVVCLTLISLMTLLFGRETVVVEAQACENKLLSLRSFPCAAHISLAANHWFELLSTGSVIRLFFFKKRPQMYFFYFHQLFVRSYKKRLYYCLMLFVTHASVL